MKNREFGWKELLITTILITLMLYGIFHEFL